MTSVRTDLRPNLVPIAAALEMSIAPLPRHIVESIAAQAAWMKTSQSIVKHESSNRCGPRDSQFAHADEYQRQLRKFSRPKYHRGTPWGILTLEDASCHRCGEDYPAIRITFIVSASVEYMSKSGDTMIRAHLQELDNLLREEVGPIFHHCYDGPPGYAIHSPGWQDWDAMTLFIPGEYNKKFDSVGVAEGLRRLFEDGEFDRRIKSVVEKTKSLRVKYEVF